MRRWRRQACRLLGLIVLLMSPLSAAAVVPGALLQFWSAYQQHFIDPQGRVIDWVEGGITTSEGQSYALFFALVSNEPQTFARILSWTQKNLAQGNLAQNLPIWRWGKQDDGQWGPLSGNHAADSDLWIAYDLLQAGRLWNNEHYTQMGRSLAQQIAAQEILPMKGAGPMLIPGEKYFRFGVSLVINPSYLPPFLLASLAEALPDGPWREMSKYLPRVIAKTSPHGFSPDWISYSPDRGYFPAPQGVEGSYNAIRVYLWAGMTNPDTPGAKAVLDSLWGMALYMKTHDLPPLQENYQSGLVQGTGPSGFSAALLPFLVQYKMPEAAKVQLARLEAERSPATGLYGYPPVHYYNQNLALFGLGWYNGAFRFGPHGNLRPSWDTGSR